MANFVLQSVAIKRELIEGIPTRDKLRSLIASFTTRQGVVSDATRKRMARDIMRLMRRELLPEAIDVGRRAAQPVLNNLGGRRLLVKGSRLRGRVLDQFVRYNRFNVKAFAATLRQELGSLSGEIETAFLAGQRDGVAKKALLDDLVSAQQGEFKRLAVVDAEIDKAAQNLRAAERRLSRASKRGQKRAKRQLKDSQKAMTKARGKRRTAKDFFARFETRIQAKARDTIRRTSERAQFDSFRSAGFKVFRWVTVNGSEACPSCTERHGLVVTSRTFPSEAPGNANTFCNGACMCILVPEEHTQGNPSLLGPLKAVDADNLEFESDEPGR